MNRALTYIFYTTLFLYLLTLVFASYVGVYLSYVAIPVIVITGLLRKFTPPSHKEKSMLSNVKSATAAASSVIDVAASDFNSEVEKLNKKMAFKSEVIKPLMNSLSQEKIVLVELQFERESAQDRNLICLLDEKIKKVEFDIVKLEREISLAKIKQELIG